MFEIGPFVLDEPARVLRLDKREIALQPRVFDLLAYLVRNRERVVSKDELLDAVWPGVTVTDNSLQRAVSSLRAALREGGMEDAVKNFPRSGYRILLDGAEATQTTEVPAEAQSNSLAEARRAVGDQRWHDAIALFENVAPASLTARDLDLLALALQCAGDPSGTIPVLVRAVSAHAEAGHSEFAGADAAQLAILHLERGEIALAKGWVARARGFTDGQETSAYGFLLYVRARITAAEGNVHEALALADQAYEIGRKLKDLSVEALGLMYRGFFKLSLGDTEAGLADQDHAAAISLSSKIDPVTGNVLYCNILWACRTFGDWSRADQWTLGYQEFSTACSMEFSGACQLHRAEVLGTHGSLHDAKAHIDDALNKLEGDAPWALGDAHRVLGDIQSAIGNDDEALEAYDKSYSLGWDPEPGRAMLMLERGDAEGAYASLERSLIGKGWWTLQRQGMLLAHLALAAAHAGKIEKAKSLIEDIAGQEKRWPMPSIRALTNEASAVLARTRGDTTEALRHLHLARQLWTGCGCRLHASQVRVQIAALQLEQGDRAGAQTEIRAARAVADELQSEKLKRECDALERKLEPVA
ncbi:MAG: transcriptional regulator [Xanthobacteraceae bacterium]|nr:transcriptional regulator [Xanthobacteraceae bacterium]MCW5676641.1 transcriptional regulator [Xanthobacteraceae bacterium]